jgi:crotonobetainyl-CoA:carnitine CoA-transferase CaiB-like acyl-CoA transferase
MFDHRGRPIPMVGSALDGIKIVDLTVARAGPAAVRLLAEWGASVIRVEAPGEGLGIAADHHSSDYINLHGNKRLITADLKDARGAAIVRRLIDDADVLIENFRPSVTKRLGLDYETLAARLPRLVYGSISGFGQDGPLGNRGAVDQIIQGMSGLMSLTGEPGTPPMRVGIAVADMAAGQLLATGVLLALLERNRSGRGQWVQVSLLEALLSMLDFQAARWTVDAEEPVQAGNQHPTITPMGTFRTADGFLNVAAPNDRLWQRLRDALGRPAALDDPMFASVSARHANRDRLRDLLEAEFGRYPRAELVKRLTAADVPCGPVNSVAEAFAEDQVRHLGVVTTVDHPARGPVGVLRSPIRMSRTGASPKSPAPLASADTDEVLGELGYGADEIAQLHAEHVV